MAANFPIEYSERLPSGQAPAVRASIDVSTGEEELARSIAHFGEELGKYAANVYHQESVAEFSELKRKVDERGYAAFNAVTGDEKADAEVWKNFENDLASLQSKKSNVNDALDKHINEVLPGWQDSFNKRSLGIRRKNVHDKFEFEGQNALSTGNLNEYYKQLKIRLKLQDMTQAEYDHRVNNAVPDSILEQARNLTANNGPGDLEKAEELLSGLTSAKNVYGKKVKLSTQQLEYRNKIAKKIEEQKEDSAETYHQKYWQLLQSGDFEALEADLNDPNNTLPVTKEGGKNWWRNLMQRREEDFEQTDLKMQSKIADAVIFEPSSISINDIRNRAGLGIHGGLSVDKVSEYEEKYRMILDKDSPLNTPIAKTFFNEIKQAQSDRAFSIEKIQNDVRYGQSLDSLTDYFIKYRKKFDKDPSLKETQEYYQNLVSGFRTPERPFTDAKIQQTLGELQSGGPVSIFGTVPIPFSKSEDAINHMLRNLGPNWQKIAPEAAEIIKRKWPEANVTITQPKLAKINFEIGEVGLDWEGKKRRWNGRGWELVKE